MWDAQVLQTTNQKQVQDLKKPSLEHSKSSKIESKPSQDRAQRLQIRVLWPPRRHFQETLDLRGLKGAPSLVFGSQHDQLGSILEAQEIAKSTPKREKIDIEKQNVFSIDFWRYRTSFWKGFWQVFQIENACEQRNQEKCPTSKKHCKNQYEIDAGACAAKHFSNANP